VGPVEDGDFAIHPWVFFQFLDPGIDGRQFIDHLRLVAQEANFLLE
jgi:hypothetical protein